MFKNRTTAASDTNFDIRQIRYFRMDDSLSQLTARPLNLPIEYHLLSGRLHHQTDKI